MSLILSYQSSPPGADLADGNGRLAHELPRSSEAEPVGGVNFLSSFTTVWPRYRELAALVHNISSYIFRDAVCASVYCFPGVFASW